MVNEIAQRLDELLFKHIPNNNSVDIYVLKSAILDMCEELVKDGIENGFLGHDDAALSAAQVNAVGDFVEELSEANDKLFANYNDGQIPGHYVKLTIDKVHDNFKPSEKGMEHT